MTATQVIHEIETLPPAEQAEVIRFACRLETERQLAGGELTALAEQLAANPDPAAAVRLRAELTRGFYGGKVHA
jgi:hypothetical protein